MSWMPATYTGARVAFLMDRLMHQLGLDGKAFISILLGYGCNVPAIGEHAKPEPESATIITMESSS